MPRGKQHGPLAMNAGEESRQGTAGETPSPSDASKAPLARQEAPAGTALLVVDMLGAWSFPEADKLLSRALAIAPATRALKALCKANGIPTIYANDNHGHWRTDFRGLVEQGLRSGGERARLNEMLFPAEEDYFVLKPKQSAFFATPLDMLLSHLKVRRLLVTGVATDQCVLATVLDARMRDYGVQCPSDCLATHDDRRQAHAVRHLAEVLELDVTPSDALNVKELGRSIP